jgi:predicted N-formylglutamate amidohydrolase
MPRRLNTTSEPRTLLGPEDPPPFTVINSDTESDTLLVCDHGGIAIPAALGGLGLDAAMLARHISHDIGAAVVTRLLSARLEAPAILFNYSRLVVDPNRRPDDPTVIREISDGIVIPGNRSLDVADQTERHGSLHLPYQQAIAAMLDQVEGRGGIPAVISIHSFTPVMNGYERPWHVGVLTNVDRRMGDALMASLSADKEICVGDNLPYSGMSPYGYTIETQAVPKGFPNVLVEIRQDLINTHHGADEWADRIGGALEQVLQDKSSLTRFEAWQ